jgi:uncharacterized membrane protein
MISPLKQKHTKLVIFSPERANFLSDGFFAIIMTLLILEIPVPEIETIAIAELPHQLLELTPKFLSYFFSFYALYIYWVNHHALFQFVDKANRNMLWLNGLFLFFIALIPYVTALMGHYYSDRFAVLCYGTILLLTSISFLLILLFAKRNNFFKEGMDPEGLKQGVRKAYMGPAIHVIALIICFINVTAALIFYASIPFFFFFATRVEVMEERVEANAKEAGKAV